MSTAQLGTLEAAAGFLSANGCGGLSDVFKGGALGAVTSAPKVIKKHLPGHFG